MIDQEKPRDSDCRGTNMEKDLWPIAIHKLMYSTPDCRLEYPNAINFDLGGTSHRLQITGGIWT